LNIWGRGGGKVIASTALVLVGAFLAAALAGAAPALPEARRSPAVATIGTNAVGRIEQTFVDDSRPTKANDSFAGAPNRTLHTTIYYPALGKPGDNVTADATPDRKRGPYPLILYSHGTNSSGAEYEPLLRQWASAGYVVAAPDYPLSNKSSPGGAIITDLDQQPADARFVIDRMLALSSKRSGTLARTVDAKRIGASGHFAHFPEFLPAHREKLLALSILGAIFGIAAAVGVWLTHEKLRGMVTAQITDASVAEVLKTRDLLQNLFLFLGAIVGLAIMAAAGERIARAYAQQSGRKPTLLVPPPA